MNRGAAAIVAEGFLRGAFDVFDAMLSLSFEYAVTDMKESGADDLKDMLTQYSVVMRAKISSGGGAALLFSVSDAARFASLVLGDEGAVKDALSEDDIATLREVADPCIGGGVTNLMEKFGRDVEQPEEINVAVAGAEDAQELADFLGGAPTLVSFTFSAAPAIDSAAALLIAQGTEAIVPPNLVEQATNGVAVADVAEDASLSEAEMSDILSGFSPEEGEEAPEPTGRTPRLASTAADNIERVLDIRLVATARLGRIDLPIGAILALGPGSIIEVGHLVDEPVELLVNDKLVARGDVVVVDERFGIRITEIVSPEERIESMR